MLAPRALVLRGPGTNCDHETAHAFERAGGLSRRVHVQALAEKPAVLDDFQIFCIPGGFSYGDDIASGRILALELGQRLGEALRQFRDRGGLILGICNGFQVLLQTGLLLAGPDDGSSRQATLAHNTSGRFVDCWVHLQAEAGRCARSSARHMLEVPEVLAVHRHDQVEALEVLGRDLSSPSFQVDAMGCGHRDGATIRGLAGVPRAGAGRVDLEHVLNAPMPGEIAEHPLGQGRPADVAEADEEDRGERGVWRHGG
jgi:putative intracellular protease/amidase